MGLTVFCRRFFTFDPNDGMFCRVLSVIHNIVMGLYDLRELKVFEMQEVGCLVEAAKRLIVLVGFGMERSVGRGRRFFWPRRVYDLGVFGFKVGPKFLLGIRHMFEF